MRLGENVEFLDSGAYLRLDSPEHLADQFAGLVGGVDLLLALDHPDVVEEVGGVLPGGVGEGVAHVVVVPDAGDVDQSHHSDGPLGQPEVGEDRPDLRAGVVGLAVVVEPSALHGVAGAPKGVDHECGLAGGGEHHEPTTCPLEDVAHVLDPSTHELVAAAANDPGVVAGARHDFPEGGVTSGPLGVRGEVGYGDLCHGDSPWSWASGS